MSRELNNEWRCACLFRGQARIGNQVRVLSRPATVLGELAFIMPLEKSGKAKV